MWEWSIVSSDLCCEDLNGVEFVFSLENILILEQFFGYYIQNDFINP